jgi:putative ABC transport system substrate-binding protein
MSISRREFSAALGGAAAWPFVALADEVRRVGVLLGYSENDPQVQTAFSSFKQKLTQLGWSEDSNLRLDLRWTAGEITRATSLAKELVSLRPDAILTSTTPVTAAVHHETKTIPIVFAQVSDPIGSGFVESLSHPGGNITGFVNLEASMAEKWLELLKEIAPGTTGVGIMFNPQTAPYAEYYLKPIQAAAPKLGVTAFPIPVQKDNAIEMAIMELAHDHSGSGLILMTDSFMQVHRRLIIELTTRHKIPAMSYGRDVPVEGGLISYGVDGPDLFARAAPYVDRLLRGAKPTELPVQAPTKFELVINLQTAKALGLTVPPTLLVRADDVIE